MQTHLAHVDGVMLGRAAYHNPYILAAVDPTFYAATMPIPTRQDILQRLNAYVETELQQGQKLHHISRHLHGLYFAQPQAKQWRRHLNQLSQTDQPQQAWKQLIKNLTFLLIY